MSYPSPSYPCGKLNVRGWRSGFLLFLFLRFFVLHFPAQWVREILMEDVSCCFANFKRVFVYSGSAVEYGNVFII